MFEAMEITLKRDVCIQAERRLGGVCSTGQAGRSCARGAVLLEVVLSMGILLLGMAMIGLQIHNGLDIARDVDETLESGMLVDTLLAELDAGAVQPETNDDYIEGDFGIRAPGYAWRIEIEPTDVDDLLMLTIRISYNGDDAKAQMDTPDEEIEFDASRLMRVVYRLYPIPADMNLERDFGVTSDDLASLFGEGGGDGSGTDTGDGSGDGTASGIAALAAELGVDLSSFDFLFDPSGFDLRQLAQLPEEDFMALVNLIEELLSKGGGALTELSDALGSNSKK